MPAQWLLLVVACAVNAPVEAPPMAAVAATSTRAGLLALPLAVVALSVAVPAAAPLLAAVCEAALLPAGRRSAAASLLVPGCWRCWRTAPKAEVYVCSSASCASPCIRLQASCCAVRMCPPVLPLELLPAACRIACLAGATWPGEAARCLMCRACRHCWAPC